MAETEEKSQISEAGEPLAAQEKPAKKARKAKRAEKAEQKKSGRRPAADGKEKNASMETGKAGDGTDKKTADPLGKAESMLYRLWRKSKEALSKKEEEGQRVTEQDATAAFYHEVAVEKENLPSWLDEEGPKDPLRELWQKCGGYGRFAPEEFAPADQPPELKAFWERIRQTARLILLGDQAEVSEDSFENAAILLRTSADNMTEWMFLFPPQGGTDVTPEEIAVALDESRVKFGIDWDLAQRVVSERLYFKLLPIARGQQPVDGTDGKLIECYPRESTLTLKERPDGTIDYKSSGSTRLISIGDVICRLEPPGDPVNGVDVRGAKVQAKPGRPARFPRIKNTVVSPEGDELRSSISGHIYFENDQFMVESLLVIDGNVDGTVGNLDYDGDIRIQGDICEGFTVKATKSITVGGMVASATVVAGGNILVEKGVNGNGMGRLEAKGKICSKFLENCTAASGGDIIAESIIWSDLFCRGSVTVTAGRGVIIGGSVVALESITAKVVGNSSRRHIDITLGCPPEILEKRDKLEAELSVLQKELSGMIKDLSFLQGKTEDPRRNKQYNELCLKKPLLQMRERRMAAQLKDAYEIIAAAKRGTLRCETLFPPARIFIGAGTQMVNEVHNNCLIYGANGEVMIGSI